MLRLLGVRLMLESVDLMKCRTSTFGSRASKASEVGMVGFGARVLVNIWRCMYVCMYACVIGTDSPSRGSCYLHCVGPCQSCYDGTVKADLG